MGNNQKSALDDDLFEEFKNLYFDDYEYLAIEKIVKEKNKKDFLNEKIENPTFEYPLLESFDFKTREKGFENLKQKVNKNKNPVVRLAYTKRIDEMLIQIQMLKASKLSDDLKFSECSKLVYGDPKPEIFEYDKRVVKIATHEAFDSKDSKRIKAAEKLQNLLGDLSYDKSIEEKLNLLPKPSKDTGKILNSIEIKSVFEKAVEEMNLKNWSVKIDTTGILTNLNANQETKTINIPTDKNLRNREAPTTKKNVLALIAHELGTHARRRENGEKSKLKLLGLGLDRFLKGEEGLASFAYQQIQGAKNFAGFGSHFSVSIGVGLDGKKRDFRKVFEILKLYFLTSIEPDIDRLKQAENLAWNTCARCFRGTTCKTPGALFTKGHIYSEGNINIYKLIASGSKEIERFIIGKYDPINKNHIQILDRLRII